MISLWITIGLIIAATLVSTLGAYFSIIGLGALFSGAVVAVWLMAGSLEFAKFVLAAYLHQTWKNLNLAFKIYLTASVVILSTITSIGVFGFLSDAYQSASVSLEEENIKLENLKKQNELFTAEIDRLNYSIEEIPEDRIARKLRARAAAEPKILELTQKIQKGEQDITAANLKVLDVKKKVGPLIFIAKSMNIEIDLVVRYLILIFVLVFDPLAICLVIASTFALESRSKLNRKRHEIHIKREEFKLAQEIAREEKAELELERLAQEAEEKAEHMKTPVQVANEVHEAAVQQSEIQEIVSATSVTEPVKATETVIDAQTTTTTTTTATTTAAESSTAASTSVSEVEDDDNIIVQMNFKDPETTVTEDTSDDQTPEKKASEG